MGRVMVLGSLNVDLVTRVERHPRPGETLLGDGLSRLAGGKGANQAVAAAAAGAQVLMVGCVGDDAGGTAYTERLRARGVDVSRIRVVEGEASGHALIAVDDHGENSIIVIPGANGSLGEDEVRAVDGLGPGDVLLLQLEVPLPVVCTRGDRPLDQDAWTRATADLPKMAEPWQCRFEDLPVTSTWKIRRPELTRRITAGELPRLQTRP